LKRVVDWRKTIVFEKMEEKSWGLEKENQSF
jgi:hypothetical protein